MRRTRRPGPDRRPRVLLVCGRLDPERDGVGDYVVRLARALESAGAQVRVLRLGTPDDRSSGRELAVGGRWGLPALLRGARAARGADVVHVQFAPSMYGFRIGVGLLPLALPGRPLVTTVHEYAWWRFERRLPVAVWRLLERLRLADRETGLLVPRSTAVIVTNPDHRGAVAERFHGRVPVRSIPIGANVGVAASVDRAAARAAVRERIGAGPEAVVVAFFGFVHPVKGIRYLAEAVAMLAAEGRDVHALVVGGFESLALPADEARAFEAELRGRVEEAGAASRVHVTGFLDEAAASRLLAGADLGVLPFTHGTTAKSGSLLTLLAHGLPTAVTRGAAADPELADGDRVVLIDRVRDGAAVAAALRRLLDEPEEAAAIAERGRAWAEQRGWGAIAARHLDVYQEVLAR